MAGAGDRGRFASRHEETRGSIRATQLLLCLLGFYESHDTEDARVNIYKVVHLSEAIFLRIVMMQKIRFAWREFFVKRII